MCSSLAVVQMCQWGGPGCFSDHLGVFKEAGTTQMERTFSIRPQTADKSLCSVQSFLCSKLNHEPGALQAHWNYLLKHTGSVTWTGCVFPDFMFAPNFFNLYFNSADVTTLPFTGYKHNNLYQWLFFVLVKPWIYDYDLVCVSCSESCSVKVANFWIQWTKFNQAGENTCNNSALFVSTYYVSLFLTSHYSSTR